MQKLARLIPSLALSALAGCTSMQARTNEIDSARRASEIVVTVDDSASKVLPVVLEAFMKNQLTVSSTQPNMVEAKLPRESGFLGAYEVAARALVIPAGAITRVTLYAEETRDMGSSAGLHSERVSQFSRGRAGEVWAKLNAIALQLQPDASKRAIGGQP
jgi:hypothetical protein